MDELLPCPFCGGKAFISAKMPYFGETVTLAVVCETCNASSKHKIKREEAIKLWNNRILSADVAPRAEIKCVYAYDGEVDEYCVQSPCPNYKTVEQAKSEFAREIFDEIVESISNLEYSTNTKRKNVKVDELVGQINWVLHNVVPQRIAQLKKKYIGGE